MAALHWHCEPEVVGVNVVFFLQLTEYKWSIISPFLQGCLGKEFSTCCLLTVQFCVWATNFYLDPWAFRKYSFDFGSGTSMLGGVSDLVILIVLFPWNQSGIRKVHFMGCFVSI